MTVQYSVQKMVSDGTLSTIALGIQYLQRNDIYMRIAGEETPQSGAPSGYTWSFINNTTLKILPVVPNGVEVVVYRRTGVDVMYNVYSQNAQFDEATIDENNQQLLYIAQEYLEQGLPGAGVDTLEYVRDDGYFTYYRLRRTDGSYSDEFTVPSASNSTKVLTREALRRSYAEAGYTMVPGSFELGGTVTTATDVLLYEADGHAYNWNGTFQNGGKVVPQGSSPDTAGGIGPTLWLNQGVKLIRTELSLKTLNTYGGAVSPADSTAALNASNGTPIQIPDGEYIGNPGPFTSVGLIGRVKSKLKQIATTGNFLSFRSPVGGRISNLDIAADRSANPLGEGHQIDISGGSDVTFSDLNFSGAENKGFSILAYANDPTPIQTGFIIKSIRGKFKRPALGENSGCVLVHKSKLTLIDGVIGEGYGQFGAVELKDSVRYSVVNNVIAENCDSAMFFGSETAGNPSNNIVANVISGDPLYSAIEVGKGFYNIFNNVMVDYTASPATQTHGVTVDGGYGNAIDNIMMTGPDNTKAAETIRFRTNATNNYASIFPHYTASGVINFDPLTTRNVVVVKHPGARSDIFASSSTINGKATVTGDSASNVVFSPATGQHFGSMSGRYEWRLKDLTLPGGVLLSGDVFRFLSTGGPSLALGGGTSAQFKLFLSDGTSRTLSLGSSQSLRVDVGSGAYLQFGQSSLTPSATNTYALGAPSNAWSGGFTQTAFTVTSDERAKTTPLKITDAMLDAAAEVDWVQYQYLDRVEAKGSDGARWHFGAVAQRYVEAFARHGLDAHDYGFICYDEWNEVPAMIDEESGVIIEPAREAGSRYGIRYEEALALEAALQRRNYQRLLARIEALEVK